MLRPVSREAAITDFGLLIAYVLPGFTALWGGTYISPSLSAWIGTPPSDPPTVGGFLFVTLASIAAGITVSTVRWLVIDTLHHGTGLRPPDWDFSSLRDSVPAFSLMVDHYYRYYQFYGNMVISVAFVFVARRWS